VVRNELHTVFGDIDDLKKEKQSSAIELEQLKRHLNRLGRRRHSHLVEKWTNYFYTSSILFVSY
jgi:hypothetical protein